MKMMVAYDGTLNSKEALSFGLAKAKETGARLAVLSVFDTGRFIDYGAGPNAVEAARMQWRKGIEDARDIIKKEGKGTDTSVFTSEGDPEAVTIDFAVQEKVDLLLCTDRQKAIIHRYKEVLESSARGPVVISDNEKARMQMLGVRSV